MVVLTCHCKGCIFRWVFTCSCSYKSEHVIPTVCFFQIADLNAAGLTSVPGWLSPNIFHSGCKVCTHVLLICAVNISYVDVVMSITIPNWVLHPKPLYIAITQRSHSDASDFSTGSLCSTELAVLDAEWCILGMANTYAGKNHCRKEERRLWLNVQNSVSQTLSLESNKSSYFLWGPRKGSTSWNEPSSSFNTLAAPPCPPGKKKKFFALLLYR